MLYTKKNKIKMVGGAKMAWRTVYSGSIVKIYHNLGYRLLKLATLMYIQVLTIFSC